MTLSEYTPLAVELVTKRMQAGEEKHKGVEFTSENSISIAERFCKAINHATRWSMGYQDDMFNPDIPSTSHLEAAICQLMMVLELYANDENELVDKSIDLAEDAMYGKITK